MTTRRLATLVGLFFLAATGLYVGGQMLYGGILSADGPVIELTSAERIRVLAGVFVELLGILSIPMIAVFVYPVLRPVSTPIALSYVVLRVIESTLLIIVAAMTLTLTTDPAPLGPAELRQLVGALSEPAFLLSVGLVFPLSAMILNGMLWRAHLVPRGISGWGFAAGLLLLTGSTLGWFGLLDPLSPLMAELLFSGPIAIQEMVLAVWLIARGFAEEGVRTG